MSQKKKSRPQAKCELNLAAMLDMAFQLLTFFILTFKPHEMERVCDLVMPPPRPVTTAPGSRPTPAPHLQPIVYPGVDTLLISVVPSTRGDGVLGSISVGDVSLGTNLADFDKRLRFALTDEASPFEQVIIRVGSGLNYEHLMSVLTICKQQKLKNGDSLTKVSFVELPDGSG
jgi:biopolymer transport protein ExbD